MPRRRSILALAALWLALAAGPSPAHAGVSPRRAHRVASGESLWKIARANQCTVDELRRANRIAGTSIQPGQRLRIPPCGREVTRPSPRRSAAAIDHAPDDEDDEDDGAGRATRADIEVGESLGVAERIEVEDPGSEEAIGALDPSTRFHESLEGRFEPGATEPRSDEPRPDVRAHIDAGRARPAPRESVVAVPLRGQSFGRPQNGYLVSGKRMPNNPAAYYLRRPERAWGTDHAVDQVVRAIRQVRKRYPRVHPLAIGDFSYRHGGPISMHGSHQSGRDADIGFYFRRPPRSYPRSFVVATADNLDFPATWALITGFLRTAGHPHGVERIYMTYTTQALFYRLARKHGVPRARLDEWFQYPHGKRSGRGVIRHEPGHDEHIHVRFRCAPAEPECE